MRSIALACLLLGGWLHAVAECSPDRAQWRRQILLGTTPDRFFFLEFFGQQPGSYYDYIESEFICEAPLARPSEVDRTLIRKTTYRWDANTGVRSQKEDSLEHFDLVDFMRDSSMSLAYPYARPTHSVRGDFVLDEKGLQYRRDTHRFLVMNMDQVRQQLPDLQAEPRVANVYAQHDESWFVLTVVSGYTNMDTTHYEDILVVPGAAVRGAMESLFKLLHGRKE